MQNFYRKICYYRYHITMKNTTLSNQQRYQICLKKQKNQGMTQKEIIKWCEQELGVKVDQATISRTLKRSSLSIYTMKLTYCKIHYEKNPAM
jgi:arginine repressor